MTTATTMPLTLTPPRPDISGDILTALASKRKTLPVHTNRASMLDDPCERRLVYWRTAWEKAQPVEVSLQGIFETGNELEPIIERILADVGRRSTPRWRIIAGQQGITDDFLRLDQMNDLLRATGEWGTLAVCDVKTCSPHVWNSLSDYESLERYFWTRKWRGQLMNYALGMNQEACLLLAVNKTNLYQVKPIWFSLDLEYAERLLQKAERVNTHVAAGTLPEQINQPDECSRCPFNQVCNPDLQASGNVRLCVNEELEDLLTRRAELETARKEFDRVDKRIGQLLVQGQEVVCGGYWIKWTPMESRMPAKAAYTRRYWKKTITRLGGNEPDDE